jgi:hypothetical protein
MISYPKKTGIGAPVKTVQMNAMKLRNHADKITEDQLREIFRQVDHQALVDAAR